jgi:hypothetical protein
MTRRSSLFDFKRETPAEVVERFRKRALHAIDSRG